jgi:hypothetical protein
MTTDRDEQIRRRAHELSEQSGSQEGRETEFWLQAERELAEDRADRNDTTTQDKIDPFGAGQ